MRNVEKERGWLIHKRFNQYTLLDCLFYLESVRIVQVLEWLYYNMYIAECGRMVGTDELEMQTGVDELIESLIRSLEDDDRKVRGGVIWRLGRTGDERSVGPLITRLGDRSKYVRAGAARALGKIGDLGVVEPLRRLLEDNINNVRDATAHVLEAIERVKYGSY